MLLKDIQTLHLIGLKDALAPLVVELTESQRNYLLENCKSVGCEYREDKDEQWVEVIRAVGLEDEMFQAICIGCAKLRIGGPTVADALKRFAHGDNLFLVSRLLSCLSIEECGKRLHTKVEHLSLITLLPDCLDALDFSILEYAIRDFLMPSEGILRFMDIVEEYLWENKGT